MSIFSNLFRKKITKNIPDLGEFTYFKDSEYEYWETDSSVGKLPEKFDFGAINGNIDGPDLDALSTFKIYAQAPDKLLFFLNDLFFEKLLEQFGPLTIEQVKNKFYLKSLTCASKDKFEYGYHSVEGDFFIELFYRNGEVTEVYLDEGCCEYI